MPRPTPKDEHPAWLKQLLGLTDDQLKTLGITEDYLVDAERGWMREADYTKKTQDVAALKKIMDANPGATPEQAFEALQWAKTQWPQWERGYNALKEENARLKTATPANGNGSNGAHRTPFVSRVTVDDFYENERLRKAFADLQDEWGQSFEERARKAIREDWYQKEEIPRLEKWAGGYMGTFLSLLKTIWPADAPDVDRILKEAAVRGNPDLGAIFKELKDGSAKTTETGFNDGFKKGREEAEAELRKKFNLPADGAAPTTTTTGPLGGSTPSWRRPETATPKTAADRFAAVMGKVESKHGALPR